MRQYFIKKGNHYCTMSIFEKIGAIGWKKKSHAVKFRFQSECYWAPPRNSDDNDLNKLTGMAFGLNVHGNSVRLTWVPDFDHPGMIKIFGYTYDEKASDPKFTYREITSVQVGQTNEARIESLGYEYRITVNGVSVRMTNVHGDPNVCMRLYPYFGGNNTAPNDMTIEIEYL